MSTDPRNVERAQPVRDAQRARLKELFGEAIELAPEARAGFVATRCADDAPLRDELARLLRLHDDAGDFLAHPVALVDAVARDTLGPDDDGLAAGQHIGAHELLARLGSGGFGSVWRARQLTPVVREVAIKVLHGAGDGARVAARFAAERQALARMQHPGIAKVFDAGTTPDGRPWLSLELVDGEPIHHFCTRLHLPLARRLALFADVCLAVQHAHGKGIVHRDLKPANVLVTQRDGAICPVVIDFGVAHLRDEADEPGRDDAPWIGTPDYTSPEQAAAGDAAADTATDVYALGVVLYELVSGQRPHARGPGETLAQQLARIRDEAPPPPRQHAPGLPRELDWITARAMAKDPRQRYATAAALGDDVRRLLRHEPVAAGPGTAWYHCQRFVRRHAVACAAALMVFVSLGAGTWLALAAAGRARHDQVMAQREADRANRALALLDELWTGVDPARLGRPDYPVRELLADFERALAGQVAGAPSVELPVRRTLARLHYFLGNAAAAEAHADRVLALATELALPTERAHMLVLRARARFDRGDTAAARADADAVRAMADAGGVPPGTAARGLEVLANCRLRDGDHDGALRFATQALAERLATGDPLEWARSQMQLANLHGAIGQVDTALHFAQEAVANLEAVGPDHPDTLTALQHQALLEQRRGDLAAAEAGFRDSLQRRRRVYGDDHALTAWAEADLAWLLHERRRDAEAAPLLRRALPVLRERLGAGHLFVTEAMQRLGAVATGLRELDEATLHLTAATERFRTLPGHPVDGLIGCLGNLAALQWARGERDTAVATLQQAVARAEAELPPQHYLTSVAQTNLAWMCAERGDKDTAVTLLRRALAGATAAGRAGEASLQRDRLGALLRALGRKDEADALDGR